MEWKNGNIPHINGVTCELTDNDANHNGPKRQLFRLRRLVKMKLLRPFYRKEKSPPLKTKVIPTSFSVPGLSVTAPYAVNNSNDDADNQKHIAMDIVLSQAEADTNDCSTELYFDSCTVYYNLSQTLNLPEGWSMFSTYIQENNMSVDHLFADQSNKVIIVKNNVGATWLPDLNYNGLGNIAFGYGYRPNDRRHRSDIPGRTPVGGNAHSSGGGLEYVRLHPDATCRCGLSVTGG